MNRIAKLSLAVAALLTSSLPAMALGPVDIALKTDFASRYIWRGFDIYSNGAAFQPSITASVAAAENLGLSVGVWGSLDTDVTEKWTEFDYTASLAYSPMDNVSLSAGYIYYSFPEVDDPELDETGEVFATLAITPVAGLTTTFGAYYDHDDGEGYYLSAAADYAFTLSEKASFTLGAAVGYMDYSDDGVYAGYDGVSDITYQALLAVEPVDALTFSLKAAYVTTDDEINPDNEFYTITSVGYSF